MDRRLFGPKSPGDLVEFGSDDVAFVPSPLPPAWQVPERLVGLLIDARTKLAFLDGVANSLPAPEILLAPLQRREAIASSSIEGTYATPEELILFDMDRPEAKSAGDHVNEWREVWNYWQALNEGLTSKIPLSLALVRSLHGLMLTGVRGRDKRPGEFRTQQVHIGAMRRFNPPPAVHLAGCLESFDRSMQNPDRSFDPLVFAYLLHYQFETIHPFLDGNGRIGRLLLTITLHKWCRLQKPWLYMSAFFERNRDEYIDRLFAVSTGGDWDGWIEFCLKGTVEQAEDTTTRCRRLDSIRNRYRDLVGKEGTGSVRLMSIVDSLFVDLLVRIPDLARKHEVTYHTARDDVGRLVELGILSELPGQKVKTFISRDVFAVAYDARGGPDAREAGEQ